MSVFFYVFVWRVNLLPLLSAWSVRKPSGQRKPLSEGEVPGESDCGNVWHLPQIRHAFAEADAVFLSSRAQSDFVRRVRRERQRAALNYLSALRGDF